MAYELTDRAWNTPLEGVCKLVFLALCSRAKDHTGQQHYDCWPSLDTIASDCGISERCARGHVQWLIAQGYICRRRRGMLTSLYRIALDKLQPLATDDRQNLPPQPAESADHDRQDLHTEPAIKPVIQPVKKPIPATPAAQPVVVVANEIPENLLADWILVRSSKGRKVLTATELDNMRSEAAQAGISLADAVRECINSGWARFKAAWLPENPMATVPSATPVDAAILEKMAAQQAAPVQDVPQLSAQERAAFNAAAERIKSTVIAKPKLAWAEEAIALRRSGVQISHVRLKNAMSVLGLSDWKEVSCAA